MEIIAIIIAGLVFVAFFKQSIRKIAKYTDQIVVTNIAEGQQELIERSMDAYNEVIETCGPDFKTPDEIYNLLHKKQKRTAKTAQTNS